MLYIALYLLSCVFTFILVIGWTQRLFDEEYKYIEMQWHDVTFNAIMSLTSVIAVFGFLVSNWLMGYKYSGWRWPDILKG